MDSEQMVIRYIWTKGTCEEEHDEIKRVINALARGKAIIVLKPKEATIRSIEISGNSDDIEDIAVKVKRLFPGKVKLSDFPPFPDDNDDGPLIVNVTVTFYFSMHDSLGKYHSTPYKFNTLAEHISMAPEFGTTKPTVNIIVKERPPYLYGYVWSYGTAAPPSPSPQDRPVIDVAITSNVYTSAPLGDIVRDSLSGYHFLIDKFTVTIPKEENRPLCRSNL